MPTANLLVTTKNSASLGETTGHFLVCAWLLVLDMYKDPIREIDVFHAVVH